MADDFKYHIEQHGSLVRPSALLTARAGGLSGDALAAAEQEAVTGAAHLQRRLTLSMVGDGQFRRSSFESVVYDRVSGFAPADGPAPLADAAGIPAARRRSVTAAPAVAGIGAGTPATDAAGRLARDEVAPVLAVVDRPVFVQLPSPGYLAAVGSSLSGPGSIAAITASGAALAAILHAEIEALSVDGVAYVALGNPLYPPLLTVAGRESLAAAGVDVDAVLAAMIAADRAAVAGLAVPEDFRVGLDLTDSGPLPTTARGYDPTAVETLFDSTPFNRLGVDFPVDPAARLPLELVKPGLVISLGVVDVSSGGLETVESILDRVDPVVEERGEFDVAIATNGGFAQSADLPTMSFNEQNEKLRLVETVARYYWGNEI